MNLIYTFFLFFCTTAVCMDSASDAKYPQPPLSSPRPLSRKTSLQDLNPPQAPSTTLAAGARLSLQDPETCTDTKSEFKFHSRDRTDSMDAHDSDSEVTDSGDERAQTKLPASRQSSTSPASQSEPI